MSKLKLEIKILALLFATFLLLNIILNENPSQIETKTQIITNNKSPEIEDSDFIVDQIVKGNSSKDITNLSKKDDLVLQEELKEKNKVFIEMTNNQTILNQSNETK